MANNYTQFSVLLPKVASDKLAEFMAAVEARHEAADEEGNWDYLPLEGLEYELRDGELWMYASENGHVAAASELIQEFLNYFEIDGGIYMSWACTCSKPRINEFDGGAVVVTATHRLWLSSDQVINLAIGQGITVLNNPGYA